jgi:hypothetical protein
LVYKFLFGSGKGGKRNRYKKAEKRKLPLFETGRSSPPAAMDAWNSGVRSFLRLRNINRERMNGRPGNREVIHAFSIRRDVPIEQNYPFTAVDEY